MLIYYINFRLDRGMEAFLEFCNELLHVHLHIFGLKEPRPKIDLLLRQGYINSNRGGKLLKCFIIRRLRQHVSDPRNPPILIFPEGTCINNTSVMQFKKGSFEVGGVIYPVAIK